MIVCVLLVGIGLYLIFSGTKEKTGCGCLGALVAGFLFILIFAVILTRML